MRLYTAQEWQDRIWEWTPANERPPFPPTASRGHLVDTTGLTAPVEAARKAPGRAVPSSPPHRPAGRTPLRGWE